ncbi:MAG TPA: IS21 family transposase [Actinoplanes sp.]|nr:IS21 family transposase [Actinoplanes sp.]
MARRSKVELYEQIRKVHEREQLSIRALAERFHVHRRDVRAALLSPVPPPRKPVARPSPVLDRWMPVIDGWLEADRTAPRKQRHTARRVWQRLVAEHGAQIGESTVRRYVAEVRRRRSVPLVEVMVPQHHPLGAEAEVDFGSIHVYLAGALTELPLFVMRLSASGKGFVRAYLNECQAVFLDGHVRGFEHFGGVADRIRYDNLKAAVIKVLKGRTRLEAERFVALRSHYGFDSFFCQPGIKGSHEKGGVESEVGRFRRRHLVPVPHVGSMAELNELLAGAMALDDRRRIAQRPIPVGEHFALEAQVLRPLPAEPFDTTTVSSHRVDRKSRVSVRGALYSVPARLVGRRVEARVGAETVEVLNASTVIAAHGRARKGDEVLVLDHYLEVLKVKPGAMLSATPLARARAAGAFTEVHERFWAQARRRLGDSDGTKALIEVLLAHRLLPVDAVIAGMSAALSVGIVDPAVVVIEARKHAHDATAAVVPIGNLARFDRPPPTLSGYDDLLEAQ